MGCKQTLFQRTHSNGQQVYENTFKWFNIARYQGNSNQNHNEMSPHTAQGSYYKKDKR